MNQSIRTFLGANSSQGFYSLYGTFSQESRTVVIKGGPGSGKSGVIKKIAAEAIKQGSFVEYCYCSSDAESLDAIWIPDRNLCVVDGTAPHLTEPKFPGAKDEIFYTGQFWNGPQLQASLSEIQDLSRRISGCFARAYRYLAAAGKAAEDIRSGIAPCTKEGKLRTFASQLIRKHIKKTGKESVIRPRFLSGITPQGSVINRDTVYTLADAVYVLQDPYRIAPMFLDELIQTAEERGQEMYVFYDPLCPSVPEHVIFPEERIGFVTANKIHSFEPQNGYRIHLERFSDLTDGTKERCRNAEKLIQACLKEAFDSLKQEKAFHDDLEEYYIEAMDFRKLNTQTAKLIKTLFG